MSNHLSVCLYTDNDGFLSQECPGCERRFKVNFSEGSDKPISFCPFCGHNDTGCWWTPEQAEYFSTKAAEEVVGPELEKMARDFNHKSSGGLISMNMEVSHSPTPPAPDEPDDDWPVVTFECCGERIKYDGQNEELRCIICGKPFVLSSNDEGQT